MWWPASCNTYVEMMNNLEWAIDEGNLYGIMQGSAFGRLIPGHSDTFVCRMTGRICWWAGRGDGHHLQY
jgi:hypothetical protein